jgi:pimeloyl-ACP methyl ester carboxylesterase
MNKGIVERAFVRIAEGQVHLRQIVHEDATDLPVFLLHMSPVSSQFMPPIMTAIDDGTRSIYAPDTLGNGDSPAPSMEQPEIDYFADSVLRLADAMAIERFHVFGSHTGARIACELAATAPDRIASVTFDGIKEYDAQTKADILAHYAPDRQPDEHGTHMVWAYHFMRDQSLFFPHFKQDPEHRLAVGVPPPRMLHNATLDILKAIDTYKLPYFAAFRYRATDRLPLITSPALFLRTETDADSIHAQIDEMKDMVAQGAIMSCSADPVGKGRIIREFIAGL